MIERRSLEEWIPLANARKLADDFFGDRATYPDDAFYSRKRGIYKDIPEEFYPLLLLAENLPYAESIRLSPDSLAGPDGAILLGNGSVLTVQVTVSHERDDGYKVRHSLRDTGSNISEFSGNLEVISQRVNRILEAIKDKETKFHAGTDLLLVADKSIRWGDVLDPGLPDALTEVFGKLPPSRYAATYVAFGVDVRRMR